VDMSASVAISCAVSYNPTSFYKCIVASLWLGFGFRDSAACKAYQSFLDMLGRNNMHKSRIVRVSSSSGNEVDGIKSKTVLSASYAEELK